jgi:hypothetical protein
MEQTSSRPRTALSDPRSMVTPDAFTVSETLLGMPLASPSRRLLAVLVDLLVVGILTALTKSFSLVLGVIIALLLIRAGFKRVPVPGSAFSRAMRASVGCLGMFIGFVTLLLWIAFGVDMAVPDRGPGLPSTPGVPAIRVDMATAITGATSGIAFRNAPDLEAAEEAGLRLVMMGRDLGLGPGEVREILEELVPENASWTSDADGLIDRLVEVAARPGPADRDPSQDSPAPAVEAPAVGESDPVDADSLEVLSRQVDALVGEVRRTREEVARAEAARSRGGPVAWIRTVVDELGFGFGWATLYMTVVLSWWKGQTVGKRLLGIRVVRLDGEPITWWTAFERVGGYAAGFATGLLGFAQVYWDANRQAIHDRIVGTVVVREGMPKIIDWESRL